MMIAGKRRYGRLSNGVFEPAPVGTDPWGLLDESATGSTQFEDAVPVDSATKLEVPVPVGAVRDFITFEQHTAGSLRAVSGTSEVPQVWHEQPAFYFTNPHGLTGTGYDIPIPPGSERFDFELEVAAVIGKDGYNLSVEEAWEHIAGFTIFNDWSARDLQSNEMKVGLGPAKGKDTATTVGPAVVTLDELTDKRQGDSFDLAMEVRVNDKVIGTDSLANMAWSFAELIAYASRGTWVRRGDVIGSGTCGGGCLAEFWGWYGEGAIPPVQGGDTVTMTVEKLGTISNTVTAGATAHPVPSARRREWSQPQQP
jgi:2-keto-4-pentenoate hydratase/2-oxohepta-3-ene-1,7-dioic acid hydratase in catechol pathway